MYLKAEWFWVYFQSDQVGSSNPQDAILVRIHLVDRNFQPGQNGSRPKTILAIQYIGGHGNENSVIFKLSPAAWPEN